MSGIKQQLDTYEVYLNMEDDRYQNNGFFLSRCKTINEHGKFPNVSILEIVKTVFAQALFEFCFFITAQILHNVYSKTGQKPFFQHTECLI